MGVLNAYLFVNEWMMNSRQKAFSSGEEKAVLFLFISTWITEMSLSPEKLVLAHSWLFMPLNPSFIFVHLVLTEPVIKKAKEENISS